MNISAMQRDLAAIGAAATALLQAQMQAAEKENRARTTDEIAAVQAKLDEGVALKARIDRAEADATTLGAIGRLTAGMVIEGDPAQPTPAQPARVSQFRSMGAQFVDSDEYKRLIKGQGHKRAGSWVSEAIELQQQATTLDTSVGSGGPLILPQVLPGIQPLFFKRLTVGALLPQGTTDSNALLFLQEKTFTNAAAAVAEGTDKPQSTLVFQQATSPVQKIAHWLPVTEEMLEDYSAIRSYIDARLRLGLDLTEEDELLNGSGIAPHLTGLMTVAGMTATQAAGADSPMDAIFKEITKITTTAFIQPDAIVMNPANWQTVQLAKNVNGQYYGAGPWASAQPPTLWGLPVAVTPSIVANTALVGAFQMCAQEFTKGGIRVEISNSHSDFFVKNLIAIRAEERLALCIYRPAGFGKVTGLA